MTATRKSLPGAMASFVQSGASAYRLQPELEGEHGQVPVVHVAGHERHQRPLVREPGRRYRGDAPAVAEGDQRVERTRAGERLLRRGHPALGG